MPSTLPAGKLHLMPLAGLQRNHAKDYVGSGVSSGDHISGTQGGQQGDPLEML